MELIDRYTAEVGRNLPEKMRPDIERELSSTLEDMLDDRSQAEGRAPDEAMVVEMLKEYGSPRKVAESYHAPRYLIGPRIYPLYIKIIKIVLPILAVLMVVQFGFSVTRSSLDLVGMGRVLAESVGGFIQAAITFFGAITLAFALTERLNPDLKDFELDEDWDPRKLKPAVSKPDTIKTSEVVVETVFSLIAILMFTVYISRVGFYYFGDEVAVFIPILTDTFMTYIPWMVGIWGLGIVKNIILLGQGQWTPATRWFSIALHAANAILAVVILQGPPIVDLNPQAIAELAQINVTGFTLERLREAFQFAVRLAIGIGLIASLVDMGKEIYQALVKKN